MKENKLANQLADTALRQLTTSYLFKLPRITQIRKYRDLYNGKAQRQLRVRYNVPIPVFAGMIDTLQADLDDAVILKYEEQDPSDWKAAQKANAALQRESQSMRPGAKWNQKFRMARQECIMTGRGILKYLPSSEDGYSSDLYTTPFEDFYFEPKGGGQLENHLFCGEGNIWKTKKQIVDNANEGIYDSRQVKKLLNMTEGYEYKQASFWDNYDFANRFQSLNLSAEANNYVGEPVFNLIEWCLTYKGERWYMVIEAFSGIWLRFEKLTDVFSSGLYPWMSFASHEDAKNFATKGFADDLYPVAVAMTDLFNEDLENRKRRTSNARAFDKDMFPNVKQLDEAQMGRDRLVSVDTKGGTRKIADGIYEMKTPEITGTIDMLGYLEQMTGRNVGVTDLQQGGSQSVNKKVGIAYAELTQVSKRLSFESQNFIEVGQELGIRFFNGLQDYMRQPLAIKLLGETGYQWDQLRRVDLSVKKDFEITVTSQSKENKMNELAKQNKLAVLNSIRNTPPANPGVNARMIDETTMRDVAGLSETDIALILDPNSHATKETIAETSAAIQDLMLGRKPKMNYNATAYFLQTLLDFVKTHQEDPVIKKRYKDFLAYIQAHVRIAGENEDRRAQRDVSMAKAAAAAAGAPPAGGGEPTPQPSSPAGGGAPVQLPTPASVGAGMQ